MTARQMTRKKALELAQECIGAKMQTLAVDANIVAMTQGASPTMQRRAEQYAELAAALAYIEHMARQKEMEL